MFNFIAISANLTIIVISGFDNPVLLIRKAMFPKIIIFTMANPVTMCATDISMSSEWVEKKYK